MMGEIHHYTRIEQLPIFCCRKCNTIIIVIMVLAGGELLAEVIIRPLFAVWITLALNYQKADIGHIIFYLIYYHIISFAILSTFASAKHTNWIHHLLYKYNIYANATYTICPVDTATAGCWAGVGPRRSTEIWICCGIGGTHNILYRHLDIKCQIIKIVKKGEKFQEILPINSIVWKII
jgi:hypothetical protein